MFCPGPAQGAGTSCPGPAWGRGYPDQGSGPGERVYPDQVLVSVFVRYYCFCQIHHK